MIYLYSTMYLYLNFDVCGTCIGSINIHSTKNHWGSIYQGMQTNEGILTRIIGTCNWNYFELFNNSNSELLEPDALLILKHVSC